MGLPGNFLEGVGDYAREKSGMSEQDWSERQKILSEHYRTEMRTESPYGQLGSSQGIAVRVPKNPDYDPLGIVKELAQSGITAQSTGLDIPLYTPGQTATAGDHSFETQGGEFDLGEDEDEGLIRTRRKKRRGRRQLLPTQTGTEGQVGVKI